MFKRKQSTGNYLDDLQRDSWQLELIITGFAVAGMLSGLDEVTDSLRRFKVGGQENSVLSVLLNVGSGVFYFCYLLTLFHFGVNIVVRCLWIGAVGARSVLGQIRLHKLRPAPRFARFLQHQSADYDTYIRRLDDVASLIFAVTILTIAALVSLLAWMVATQVLVSATSWLREAYGMEFLIVIWASRAALIAFLITSLIYLIDFLTVSKLKRIRLFSVVYYPLYRLMGWVTFARLYRPLYYNLVTTRGTKWLVPLIIPYILLFITVGSMYSVSAPYLRAVSQQTQGDYSFIHSGGHYRDGVGYDVNHLHAFSLQSNIITQPVAEVHLALENRYAETYQLRCPNLIPDDPSMIRSDFWDGFTKSRRQRDQATTHSADSSYVACLTAPLRLFLDDRPVPLDEVLYATYDSGVNLKGKLVTYVALDSVPPGLHRLRLEVITVVSDSTQEQIPPFVLPFYYAPG